MEQETKGHANDVEGAVIWGVNNSLFFLGNDPDCVAPDHVKQNIIITAWQDNWFVVH